MNLNEFSQAKSEFSQVVWMVRNHIAEEHFISKFILSVSNSHERLGEAMDRFDVKCQIWRQASSPCFKAVGTSPKRYYIAHKSMCQGHCRAPGSGSLTHWKKWYPSLFSNLNITPFFAAKH